MTELNNQIAVVTGAAGGLGSGIARALATSGCVVVCADYADASAVAADLPASPSGTSSYAITLDVADTAAVEEAFASITEKHGRLDILVNNAGVAQPIAPVAETPDDVIERVFAVNVRGVIACSRAAVPPMRSHGGGRIVNVASQVGKRAWPGWGVYSASKAAVLAITQVMALEHAEDGILVNAVCPGTMLTDMTRSGFKAGASPGDDWEANLARHASSIPLGRLGTAEDIGEMVAWIVSPRCAFTTGAAFNLTGGEAVYF